MTLTHVHIDTCRTERLELRAELLAAVRDLDGRLATCRDELSRQGWCMRALVSVLVVLCGCERGGYTDLALPQSNRSTASEAAAAQERSLESLNALLTSAMVRWMPALGSSTCPSL